MARRLKRTVAAMKAEQELHDLGIEESAQPNPLNGAMPELPAAYQRIVTKILDIADPLEEYDYLEEQLTLGSARDHELSVRKALDQAEDNARRATQLYWHAKVAYEKLSHELDIIDAALWSAASAQLQSEKAHGARAKAITDKDVSLKAATLFPDQWKDAKNRRVRAEAWLAQMKVMMELWRSRCVGLQVMMRKFRDR